MIHLTWRLLLLALELLQCHHLRPGVVEGIELSRQLVVVDDVLERSFKIEREAQDTVLSTELNRLTQRTFI